MNKHNLPEPLWAKIQNVAVGSQYTADDIARYLKGEQGLQIHKNRRPSFADACKLLDKLEE